MWFDQFLKAVTVKDKVSPKIILEDPKPIVAELEPRPEIPRTGDAANAIAAREARDRMMRDHVAAENEEKRESGPKEGHNIYYNEVQKRLVSRLFLALGTEEKTICTEKSSRRNFKTGFQRNG